MAKDFAKKIEKKKDGKKSDKKAEIKNVAVKVYDQSGKSTATFDAPGEIFGLNWNADLVHQVVHSMRSSARQPSAHTKSRADVSGGGKKPWAQKGTGRARHGSTRSPIWVGGGVAHGPRNDKSYDRKVNKKMKVKAIYTILSQKLRDGEVLFLNSISLDTPKTKDARTALTKLGTIEGFEMLSKRRNNAALITVPVLDSNVKLGFQNMGNLEVMEVRNINPLALLQYKYVVMTAPEEAVKTLSSKMN
jgi:large subunit ribosomal protein L4